MHMCGRNTVLCADSLLVELEWRTKTRVLPSRFGHVSMLCQPSRCDGLLAPKDVEYRQPQGETAYLETTNMNADRGTRLIRVTAGRKQADFAAECTAGWVVDRVCIVYSLVKASQRWI